MTQSSPTIDGLYASGSLTSPAATFNDSTFTMSDRNSSVNWSHMQSHPSIQPQLYPFQMQPTVQSTPQFHSSQYHQFVPQPLSRYVPKSLDGLVPDPPDMMGIRPAFNGDPIPTFAPHPSMLVPFSHGSTFPTQVPRRNSVNNPPMPNYNPSSQLPYMPDMGQ